MKRAKRRKQASSKIKHGEIKRINGMSKGIFKGSFRFIYIYILILTAFRASSAVDVIWEAKYPAIFGNVTYLQCNISDRAFNCTKRPRQWYGGPQYDSLCYEDNCTTSNKYEVMKQSRCQYTLMIHHFSERDVNCEYTCLYGISNMRRNLTLDEKVFIYEPHVADIKEETIEKDKTLDWRINITKIFPKPSCGADLNEKNITNGMQISVTKPGFYFAADLLIKHHLPSCGKISVYCFLGDYKINITSKNVHGCQGGKTSNNENTGNLVWILLSVLLVIIISCVFLCRRRIRKRLC